MSERSAARHTQLDRRTALKLGAASLFGVAAGSALAVPAVGARRSQPLLDDPINFFIADPRYRVIQDDGRGVTKLTRPLGLHSHDGGGEPTVMVYRSSHLVVSPEGREVLASRGLTVDDVAGRGSTASAVRVGAGANPDRRVAPWLDDPIDLWQAMADLDDEAVGRVGVDFLLPLSSHFAWFSAFEPLPIAGTPPAAPASPDPDAPIVGLIDTGVDVSHPWMGTAAVTAEAGATESMASGSGLSAEYGHGTAVCGVVRQANPNRRIVMANGLGSDGLISDQGAADALVRLVDQHGASVVSLSFGTLLADSVSASAIALTHAIETVSSSATVVAASGNDGLSGAAGDPTVYPAALPDVTAVTASEGPGWANTGSYVDDAAPGVEVVTAYPTGGGSYARWSGTSFAAPAVAAAL